MTTISAKSIVAKKRDKGELTKEELGVFVKGMTSGNVSRAQVAAFAMAAVLNGKQTDFLPSAAGRPRTTENGQVKPLASLQLETVLLSQRKLCSEPNLKGAYNTKSCMQLTVIS